MNAEEQRAWASCDRWQVRSFAVELVNPVTAPVPKPLGLNDAQMRLQTEHFPVL